MEAQAAAPQLEVETTTITTTMEVQAAAAQLEMETTTTITMGKNEQFLIFDFEPLNFNSFYYLRII